MNKIVSNFYLIRLNGEPVYVGYTNRTIKQRFSEHKRDKDFGGVEPTVDSLGKLQYDFTWDMELINRYAREVGDKETKLILEYGTQNSVWQKGISGNVGGQTWADVKNFVRTNRDNPKFRGLPEEAILAYLETSDRVAIYLKHFVSNMDDPVSIYMKSFVSTMDDPVAIYLKHFVSNMDDPVSIYMKNFISTMDDPVATYLKNFISNMDDPVSIYMKHFVNTMDDPVSIYMKNFVSHMDDPVAIYLKNFVGNMKKPIDN